MSTVLLEVALLKEMELYLYSVYIRYKHHWKKLNHIVLLLSCHPVTKHKSRGA